MMDNSTYNFRLRRKTSETAKEQVEDVDGSVTLSLITKYYLRVRNSNRYEVWMRIGPGNGQMDS